MIKSNSSIALCMKYKILFALVVIGPLIMMGCKASKPADTGELSSASKSVVTTDSVQDAANGVAQEADETEGLPAGDAIGGTSQNQTDAQSPEVDALEASPLRVSFKECSDASAGVTSAMQDCIAEEYEYQDLRLNEVYAQLKKELSKQKMDQLKVEQRKWLADRDAKCAWDEKTEGQAQRLQANYCAMEKTAKRSFELQNMLVSPVTSSVSQNGLELEAGDISINLIAQNCSNETTSVDLCNNSVMSVTTAGNSSKQVINLPALYLSKDKAVYRGLLNTDYKMRGYSFVIADVNADRQEDLLVWTGKLGANGGASFGIYLRDGTKKQWVFNKAFSELTDGKNGVISVVNGKLKVSSKSGCCVHINETYMATANAPKLEERVTEDATGGISPPKKTVEKMTNGKMEVVN